MHWFVNKKKTGHVTAIVMSERQELNKSSCSPLCSSNCVTQCWVAHQVAFNLVCLCHMNSYERKKRG